MKIDQSSHLGKWYKVCCRILPFTPEYRSTVSLCLFVWTTVWMPLIASACVAGATFLLIISPALQFGWLGLLAFPGMVLAFVVCVFIVWIFVIGVESASRVPAIAILGTYTKAIKSHICPLIEIK